MKKVVYSITRKNGMGKMKGVGYIAENNLFIPAMSKQNNPYIRVLEDVTKYCHPTGKDNEFTGIVPQAFENVYVHRIDKVRDKDYFDTIDYKEIEYYVWYKYIE